MADSGVAILAVPRVLSLSQSQLKAFDQGAALGGFLGRVFIPVIVAIAVRVNEPVVRCDFLRATPSRPTSATVVG